MHLEKGIITEEKPGQVLVLSDPEVGCKACQARNTCIIGQEGARRKRKLWIPNTLGAHSGDMVSFSISEWGMILVSTMLYILPVIFLVAGSFIGSSLWSISMDPDMAAAIGGASGLAISFAVIRILTIFTHKSSLFSPQLIQIINDEGCDSLK